MTDSQFPRWMLELTMKERNRIVRQCEKIVLCIARETRGPLTANEVGAALEVKRVVVLRDERIGHYWVRVSDNESSSFLKRIRERGLPGFVTREIDRNEEEWEKLAGVVGDFMGLRNGSGPSQLQTSVEQQPDAPSTPHSLQLQADENLESGNEENSTSSLGLGGSGAPSGSNTSKASSASILGSDSSGHASANPTSDKRPRKKRRCDHEVSQVGFSSPTTNSTHEESALPLNTAGASSLGASSNHAQSAPPLDTTGVPPPEASSTHEQSAPPLNTAGVSSPGTSLTYAPPPPLDTARVPPPETSSTQEQPAPLLNTAGVSPLGTTSTHAQSTPPLDTAGVPSPEASSTHTQPAPPLDTAGTPPPETSSTHPPLSPLLDIFLRKLSPELITDIFQRCVEDTTSFSEYNSILETLASHGGRCFQILEGISSLWTKITSLSSKTHIKMALRLSCQRPLHIQGFPSGSRTVAANLGDLSHLLIHVEPHRDRWASFSLLFPPRMMKKVQWCLARPAPGLQTLSLSMANMALETEGAIPLGAAAPMEEIDRSLKILGGGAGNLQRLFFNNIPYHWDPSSFTEIRELGLTNGIRLRFMETITFLRHSSNLTTLRLVNVRFVGDAPHVVEETIVLPSLRELVFAELIERSGLGLLWLSIDTPACSKLHLALRPSEALVEHTALPARAAPAVQKALAANSKSFLLFRCNIEMKTQSATWRSQDVDGLEQSEPQASFDISFRGLGNGLARVFCDVVRGIRESVGDVGGIVVSVADSFSGAIDPPPGVELDDLVPTLFPNTFRGLNVVEVRADIADKYLQLLLETMAPPAPQVWWLDSLRTIHLYAIPEDKLALEPHETIQRSIEDFIQLISKHHYGMVLGLDEPKPPGKRSLSVVLEGKFHITRTMGQALEEGRKWWGVTIKDADASLIYGGVQEKGTAAEEQVSGEEVGEADESALD